MLHTLHRSPWLTDFAALLRLLSEGDELLLLQDGVTAAVDGNRYLESLRNAPIKVYAPPFIALQRVRFHPLDALITQGDSS